MKSLLITLVLIAAFSFVPAVLSAQTYENPGSDPPIAQPLVREGDFAVKLAEALRLGTAANEMEAENLLGSTGIAPRSGWISDYPVTPVVIGELRDAVSEAADSSRLTMVKEEALSTFDQVVRDHGLPVTADTSAGTDGSAENYPEPTVVNNYYYSSGPPVVTYYAPPYDYAYLYTWVPYPFWWWNFHFTGFFVLTNFHKVFVVDRKVVVLSNRFFDHNRRAFVRINAFDRFHGKVFVDHGKKTVAFRDRKFVDDRRFHGGDSRFVDRDRRSIDHSGRSTVREGKRESAPSEVRRGSVNTFDAGRSRFGNVGRGSNPERRIAVPPAGSGSRGSFVTPDRSRTFRQIERREFTPRDRGVRSGLSSDRQMRTIAPQSSGTRSFSPSSNEGRRFSAPSTHREFKSFGGNRGSFERTRRGN